jgi:hypothetical protein
MPRRRSRALRAAQEPLPVWTPRPPDRIPGLPADVRRLIHRIEARSPDPGVFPGATALALRRNREFLGPAGPHHRFRYPATAGCPAPACALDDVTHARDVLEDMLLALPPGRPRAELRRLIRPLDADFTRRTLPNPLHVPDRRPRRPDQWWHGRIYQSF